MYIILEFSLAIASTSSTIGKVFSITNVQLTDDNNNFLNEIIKAVTVMKRHF